MANSSRREKIDPIWWAPVLLLVIAAITTLTALLFSGSLRKTVPLTVVSDRAGLVMEDGAKVKLRGVQIGEVTSIGAEHVGGTNLSTLKLKIDPGPFQYLPSNVEAEIKSSTAFGAKYVDLLVPSDGASGRLAPGAVLHSRNVTVEVKEKPTGTFSIGAGFNTLESFQVMGRVEKRNLFGYGVDAIFSFSYAPLRVSFLVGAAVSVLAKIVTWPTVMRPAEKSACC